MSDAMIDDQYSIKYRRSEGEDENEKAGRDRQIWEWLLGALQDNAGVEIQNVDANVRME